MQMQDSSETRNGVKSHTSITPWRPYRALLPRHPQTLLRPMSAMDESHSDLCAERVDTVYAAVLRMTRLNLIVAINGVD